MKTPTYTKILSILCFIIATGISKAQQTDKTPAPNYALAAKFSPTQLAKLVHSTSVNPHWLKNGNKFWYQYKTTAGSNYYLVDADKRSKTKLFNNDRMAAWLTEITKDPYDGQHLPKFDFEFVNNERAIRFRVTSSELVPVAKDKKASAKGQIKPKKEKKKKKRKKNKS